MQKQVRNTLEKIFPIWTKEQVQGMVRSILNWRKKNISEEDLFTCFHDAIEIFGEEYPDQQDKPQLLAKIVKNRILEVSKRNKKSQSRTLSYEDEQPQEYIFGQVRNAFESEFGSMEATESIKKIERFCQLVNKHLALEGVKGGFFDAMVMASVSEEQVSASNQKKQYWKEVEQNLHKLGYPVNENYFRKLKERVLSELKKMPTANREVLHFIDKEKEAVLQTLDRVLDAMSITVFPMLASYRFSTEELEKMNWLKSIFEKNGYAFNPNRFPEVYYANFKEVEDLFPEKQREEIVDPDALGYYFGFFHLKLGAGNDEKFGGKSEEGKIILFKDRIEAFCARNRGLSEEGVRFVVLMHELGHWMSHWAQFSGKRWIYGFQFSNRFTEEALAQLIAYWCCNGNPLHEKTLHLLSPKDSLGKVDASRIYGAYQTLKGHSQVDVLKKLCQLREFWMVKDQKMVEFLGSDSVDLAQWIEEKGKTEDNSLQYEFIEEWMLQFLWDQIVLASDNNRSLNIKNEIFRALEIADPKWESMGLKETLLKSNELGF
jgi:hypothetical protein